MTLCAEPNCPAEATPGHRKCPVHESTIRAAYKSPCPKCRRQIQAGEWVTLVRAAHGGHEQQHAECPKPKGKPDRGPSLFAEGKR